MAFVYPDAMAGAGRETLNRSRAGRTGAVKLPPVFSESALQAP